MLCLSFEQTNTNTQMSTLLRTRALDCCLAQVADAQEIPGVAILSPPRIFEHRAGQRNRPPILCVSICGAALTKTNFVAITSRLGIRGPYISKAPIYGHFKPRGATAGVVGPPFPLPRRMCDVGLLQVCARPLRVVNYSLDLMCLQAHRGDAHLSSGVYYLEGSGDAAAPLVPSLPRFLRSLPAFIHLFDDSDPSAPQYFKLYIQPHK
jgi:hypothetical protein